ncbi:hypothetical protein [Calothrix sp. NIES-3974]|uniref:hypothetical protein n=1 Tax=Calothrix sp. NIES-3974 TaxID=2005462 RepID=UPI000B602793|nr:hypothetical protein [Calothrix sp. NIES-3974]BAZ05729.1 hypothetical protein NIES3974_23830 [Calothrix sp. NIES-3974]
MKKIYTFCFLAASLIITPGVAFAGQSSSQNMNQTSVIQGSGNSVNINGTQTTNQYQSKKGNYPFCHYGYSGSQSQSSEQNLNQGAFVAGHGNSVNISGSQATTQAQIDALRAQYCY